MADVDDGTGYKLVTRNYGSLVDLGSNRYTPGTTHWIECGDGASGADWGGLLPPPPTPCTQFALHYCRHALQTVRYAVLSHNVDDLRLLRVTPLRWPGASASDLPLFIDDDSEFPKRGTHGLRIDAEITDADERRALLSGTLRRREGNNGRIIETTITNGHVTAEKHTDALGNRVYERDHELPGRFVGHYILASNWNKLFPRLPFLSVCGVAQQCAYTDATAVVLFVVRDWLGKSVRDLAACRVNPSAYHVQAQYRAADVIAALKRFKDETTAAMQVEEVVL